MIRQVLAVAGAATAALALASGSAMAIGDADGSALSSQGDGGTNVTGTTGNHSPAFHTLDNANVCLPEVHHVQVGVLVPVQADVPIANQQGHQVCNVGQTTQADGDGPLSHLVG